jgi:hypothetical protein
MHMCCCAGAAVKSQGADAGNTTPAAAAAAAAATAAEVVEDAAAAAEVQDEGEGPVCAEQQESLLGVQLKVEVLTALVSKMEHLVGRAEATARALQVGGQSAFWADAAPTGGATRVVGLGPICTQHISHADNDRDCGVLHECQP